MLESCEVFNFIDPADAESKETIKNARKIGISDASSNARKRLEGTLHKDHEDHVA